MAEALTLLEACEKVPELYEAMRLRDSLANRVCELTVANAQAAQVLHKWSKQRKLVTALYARALDA